MTARHQVVVIGAGFGGLRVVRGLERSDVEMTIIDTHNFHTFQPLLYQVATAGLASTTSPIPCAGSSGARATSRSGWPP